MRVVIRGGGDIATGIALRLIRSGMEVVICEQGRPTAIRRTVSFSEAMRLGETAVEGVTARRAHLGQVESLLAGFTAPPSEKPQVLCLHADLSPGPYNPITKEEITIAAATVPSFKAGKALKDAVAGK